MDTIPENKMVRKGRIRRFLAFGRSADPGQRRAAGNIFKFLALLLIITLIARGTSGVTLARVDISPPSRGTIMDTVTGTAVISSKSTTGINAPQGLTIAEMIVDSGQNLKKGDAIARFDIEELTEKLARELASLDKNLIDFEKLERPETADATTVASARSSLQRAREDYGAAVEQGDADTESAREALDEALLKVADEADVVALQTAIKNLQRARDDHDYVKAQGETDVAAALKTLDDAKESRAEPADTNAVETAQRNLQRAKEDYNATATQGNLDVSAAWEAYQNNPENTQLEQAAMSAQRRADENLLTAKRKIEDAESALAKAEQDYEKSAKQLLESWQDGIDKAQSAYDSAIERAQENLLSAGRKVEDAEASLDKAESDLNKSIQQASDAVITEIEKAQNALEAAQNKAEDNKQSARRRLEDAEATLKKSEQDYSKNERQTEDTQMQNRANATILQIDIENQKLEITALEELIKNDGILYSELDGTVFSAMSEGSVTGAGQLVTLLDGATGYEAQMRVKQSEADKLAVGGECQVTSGSGSLYFTPMVTGVITGISPVDDNDMVTVTIRLPDADWSEGQRADVQAVLSSGSYDLCVPVTALHSDNSGYYLYAVEQRSTVLGLQNVITRLSVNLIAADDEMASVRGAVDRNSQVVTGSNKALTSGDRVRVNE